MRSLIVLLFVASSAQAHETVFPHSHPHPFFSLVEDFLLTGVWFALWGAIFFGGYRVVKAVNRKRAGRALAMLILSSLFGCGQVPSTLTVNTDANKAAAPAATAPAEPGATPESVPVPAATAQPSGGGGSTNIPLTYYTLSRTSAPQAGWATKTYTATGHCVVYVTKTYCWDDGVKTLAWVDFSGTHYGPFCYTYWNMSQDAVGWSKANGGLAQDLMPTPRLISSALSTNIGAANITAMFAGAATQVQCTESATAVNCGSFTIDLTQAAL